MNHLKLALGIFALSMGISAMILKSAGVSAVSSEIVSGTILLALGSFFIAYAFPKKAP